MILVEFCVIWFHDRSRVHIYTDHPAQSANCPHPFPACIFLLSLLHIVCKTHGEVRRGKAKKRPFMGIVAPAPDSTPKNATLATECARKGGGGFKES
ncbi:hypothetical protein CPAR01_11186 [Colletotrichum paranaense]|uniref:Secreted protein n=1 Tax=Colletotrichum paranaense TaxID=1914294 RepID=A0ABQ9SAX7_9PEZI|nr:uncharacterized protein CPAR01_11186 [Colletotrichum paranaense]KAK1531537.1 hypothetical protein CPAR01_11186 [Colletotrichum paranaense]